MTDRPKNTGRNTAGRFTKGNKFGGKKAGSRHKVTVAMESILDGEHERLTRKAIELALAGDTTALRLCLDRLAPPRRDRPIEVDIPPVNSAKDALNASRAIIASLLRGEITPNEAGQLMGLISKHVDIIEMCDLEMRLVLVELRMERLK